MTEKNKKPSLNGAQRLLEVGLLASIGFAVFLMLSLVSFDLQDPSWSQSAYSGPVNNAAGAAGAWIADLLFVFLGVVAYVVPLATAFFGWSIFRNSKKFFDTDFFALGLKLIGVLLTAVAVTSLASLNFDDIHRYSSGGLLGDVISQTLMPYFNFVGTTLIMLCFFCTGLTLTFGFSWLELVEKLGEWTINFGKWLWQLLLGVKQKLSESGQARAEQKALDKQHAQAELEAQNQAEALAAEQAKTIEVDDIEDAQEAIDQDAASRLFGTPSVESNQADPLDEQIVEAAADTTAEQGSDLSRWQAPTAAGEVVVDEGQALDTTALPDYQQPVEESKVPEAFRSAPEPKPEPERTEPAIGSLEQIDIEEMLQPSLELEDEPAPVVAKQHIKVRPKVIEDIFNPPAKEVLSPIPGFELLDRPDKKRNPVSVEEMQTVAKLVESKLLDYGVECKVVGMYPGPVITRLELDLAPGVKVSKISNLSKDIARSLSAVSVRVVEVIPGKSVIGLELPNKHREIVRLSEVIEGSEFADSKSPLTMVLGQDIAGEPVVTDLAKMPHLLVAGTTGSGKSVGVNVMILSLLYKSTPDDVRLIMIDPKMLELSVYEGIPHLLCEVVTDMKDASNALRWCVGEMERRYKLMSAMGVRNLKGFNAKVKKAIEEGEPLTDPIWKPGDSMDETAPELEKLPAIVVVIDEFADMMMIVGKKVEELIARIAQKARAAGIHLILATQRPSVDVITGLIKANIPTRMAFQVSTRIDSRTILDQQGAETLLGMGDMLYLPSGSGVPTRVHGAFVDDHEVHALVAEWKKRGSPMYIDEILSGDMNEENMLPGEQAEGDEDAENDALYDEAVAFVTEKRKVSVSSVQRQFRIGYNRAARIVEQMEASGVVSSAGHNGAREVLAAAPPKGDF